MSDIEKTYCASNITIRFDNQTGNLCLYVVEIRAINEQEHRVAAVEEDVKDPNNVIRWQGRPKPAARGWARSYLNKEDYERYGKICSKVDAIMTVDSDFDYDKRYTKQDLITLIDRINERRKKKDEFGDVGQR